MLDKHRCRGFTLIELLIVIAILGVLAAGILVAINPLAQLQKARDAGRKTAIQQISQAMERYAISHDGIYPTDPSCGSNCWTQTFTSGGGIGNILITSGELKQVPQDPSFPNSDEYHNRYNFGNAVNCWNPNGKAVIWGWLENTNDREASHTCGDTSQPIYYETDGSGKRRPIYMFVSGIKVP